jgi:hypothetical protein
MEILRDRFFFACDSCYSVVSDVLSQVAPQKQGMSLSVVTPQITTTSIPVAPDAEAKLNSALLPTESNPNLSRDEQGSSGQVKIVPKTQKSSNTSVRVMGILLSPDKEYKLRLIPDGAGNYYLDIWEIKE